MIDNRIFVDTNIFVYAKMAHETTKMKSASRLFVSLKIQRKKSLSAHR